MSFGRSKVERFPTSSGGIKIKLQERKRPYMYSDLSSSMSSSFHRSPTQKERKKEMISGKRGGMSNSTGCKNKLPIERISALRGSQRKVIVSKPQCSPTFRGGGSNAKRNLRRSSITPSKNLKQQWSSKKKEPVDLNIAIIEDSPTLKRKKLCETSYESYSTPLTSPQSSPDKTDESTVIIEQVCTRNESGRERLTPFPPESTQIFITPHKAPWENENNSFGISASENSENERVETPTTDEDVTVITAGRMPMRRSSSRPSIGNVSSHLWSPTRSRRESSHLSYEEDEQFGRRDLNTRHWESSFDFLNNAFMQLSIQDAPQHAMDTPSSLNLTNCSFPQVESSFSWDNIRFPVPSTPRRSNVRPRPTTLQDRFGNALSNFFGRKKHQPEHSFRSRSDLDTTLANMRRICPNSAPVTSRSLRRGNMVSSLPRVEMRRFLRAVRLLEARRSFEDIKFFLVIPAQMHVQSRDFWMPILEFMAGQVFEIIQSSLCH